jgi:hypothetical protein
MIVLSTSKNAATSGSGGVASDDSTSATAADASPANLDRLSRSGVGWTRRCAPAGVRRWAFTPQTLVPGRVVARVPDSTV